MGYSIFVESQVPHYPVAYGVGLGACVIGIFFAVFLRFVHKRENARRDQISVDEWKARYSEAQLMALGDKSPLFRYAL